MVCSCIVIGILVYYHGYFWTCIFNQDCLFTLTVLHYAHVKVLIFLFQHLYFTSKQLKDETYLCVKRLLIYFKFMDMIVIIFFLFFMDYNRNIKFDIKENKRLIISVRIIIDLYFQHDFCLEKEQSSLLRRPVFFKC